MNHMYVEIAAEQVRDAAALDVVRGRARSPKPNRRARPVHDSLRRSRTRRAQTHVNSLVKTAKSR